MNQVVKIQSKTINNLFYTVQKRKVAPCTDWITFFIWINMVFDTCIVVSGNIWQRGGAINNIRIANWIINDGFVTFYDCYFLLH